MTDRIEDGGPAFPRTGEGFGNPRYDTPGMSLRDHFASQAMPAILTKVWANLSEANTYTDNVYTVAAVAAYEMADAMLEARARQMGLQTGRAA